MARARSAAWAVCESIKAQDASQSPSPRKFPKKKKHSFSSKIDPLYRNSPKNYAKPLIFQGFLKKS